jgi:hypothetical protein
VSFVPFVPFDPIPGSDLIPKKRPTSRRACERLGLLVNAELECYSRSPARPLDER